MMTRVALLFCTAVFASQAVAGEPMLPSPSDMALIEQGLQQKLLDPQSLILSEVVATEDTSGPTVVWVCGNLRGKNSLGGYTQPTPFMGTLVTGASGEKTFLTIAIAGPSDDEKHQVLNTCLANF